MPVPSYSVTRALAQNVSVDPPTDPTPHYHVLLESTNHQQSEAAINLFSQEGSQLKYIVLDPFADKRTASWLQLAAGTTRLPAQNGKPDARALDYARDNLFDPDKMAVIPPFSCSSTPSLQGVLDQYVKKALADNEEIFVFGSTWLSAGKKNEIFSFAPDRGTHDVHMNQGNDARFKQDDGVGQDGGLLIHLSEDQRWVAIFLAFASQSFQTDSNGHTLASGQTVGHQTVLGSPYG